MTWPVDRTRLLAGPPGTGKTTRLVLMYREFLRRGYAPQQIATVSHTVAASDELRDRIAREYSIPNDRDTMPWACTVHAAARRSQDIDPETIATPDRVREWGLEHGYHFTGADEPATDADVIASYLARARHMMVPLLDVPGIPPAQVILAGRLAQRYGTWLTRTRMVDFAGILEAQVRSGIAADVAVALIDEAQDLSPLAVAAAGVLFRECQHIVLAGDDDQSLYGWSGSDPRWLVELAQRVPCEVLAQSYRVPQTHHRLALATIEQVRARVPKTYHPRPADGSIDRIGSVDEIEGAVEHDGDVMVVARTYAMLQPIARQFQRSGVAYACPGRPVMTPWRDDLIMPLRAALQIRDGQTVTAARLHPLLRHAGVPGSHVPESGTFGRADLLALGLRDLVAAIDRDPARAMQGLPGRTRDALAALVARGLPGEPRITLRSIHGSKGLEADHVVVVEDWGSRPFGSLRDRHRADEERRAAYVAVTRARDRLTFVAACRRRYPFPRVRGDSR